MNINDLSRIQLLAFFLNAYNLMVLHAHVVRGSTVCILSVRVCLCLCVCVYLHTYTHTYSLNPAPILMQDNHDFNSQKIDRTYR